MNTFVFYAEINAICIAVIAIIAVTSYSHLERKNRKKRCFLHSASLIAEVVRQDRRSRSPLSYMSVGCSGYRKGDDIGDLIENADNDMYRRKFHSDFRSASE